MAIEEQQVSGFFDLRRRALVWTEGSVWGGERKEKEGAEMSAIVASSLCSSSFPLEKRGDQRHYTSDIGRW